MAHFAGNLRACPLIPTAAQNARMKAGKEKWCPFTRTAGHRLPKMLKWRRNDCPVCHTKEHKLVDCPNPEANPMVRLLKDIADGEKKAPSDDSKKASASGGESKEEKPSKGERDGTNAQAVGEVEGRSQT